MCIKVGDRIGRRQKDLFKRAGWFYFKRKVPADLVGSASYLFS